MVIVYYVVAGEHGVDPLNFATVELAQRYAQGAEAQALCLPGSAPRVVKHTFRVEESLPAAPRRVAVVKAL